MKRSDVGLLVSRCLAVWVLCLVIGHVSRLPYSYMTWIQYQKIGPDHASDRAFVPVPMVEDLLVLAGLMFLALLLWKKPLLLFPGDDEPLSQGKALDYLKIRSLVMGALGLYFFAEGISTLLTVMVIRHTVAGVFRGMFSETSKEWAGPVAKIVMGAVIMFWFNYGKSARRFLGLTSEEEYIQGNDVPK